MRASERAYATLLDEIQTGAQGSYLKTLPRPP